LILEITGERLDDGAVGGFAPLHDARDTAVAIAAP
jgi:hypothetical protein